MKAENLLEKIENLTSIQMIPAKNVQIKKVTSIREIRELKNRLLFLKKATMTGGKIFYENNVDPSGSNIVNI